MTLIRFFGVLPASYPGAARPGVKPDDPRAIGWSVTVGGTHCSLETREDFVKHFLDFLHLAYAAGVADTKASVREKLGL